MEGRHRRIQNPVEHLKCNVFVKKVNGLRTLTISQKRSIVYVCQSPKCASGKYWSEKLIVDKVINSSRKSHKYKNNQLNIINLKILYFGSTRKKKFAIVFRDVFRYQSNIFGKIVNIEKLLVIFAKKLHCRCSTRLSIRLQYQSSNT